MKNKELSVEEYLNGMSENMLRGMLISLNKHVLTRRRVRLINLLLEKPNQTIHQLCASLGGSALEVHDDLASLGLIVSTYIGLESNTYSIEGAVKISIANQLIGKKDIEDVVSL